MGLNVEEFDTHEKPDFRRANGSPQWIDKEGKNIRGSRPSGWGKELDDENALVNWKIDVAMVGVASDPALQARVIAVKPDDRKAKAIIREAAIQSGRGNQAADMGTALHAMSERWEQEPDWDPGPPYRASLEAYTKEMERIGVVSELFEYHVVNLDYKAAGTADRLYRTTRPLVTPKGDVLPVDTLIVGDLKTGKSLDFSLPGYSVQMALYAQGEMYDVGTETFRPTPSINQDWGLLVHMPSNQEGVCVIQWIDLDVGNYGAFLTKEIRDWRRMWKNGTYGSPVVEVAGMAVADVIDMFEPVEVVDADSSDWVEIMLPFIKSRMKTIRENPEATKQLMIWWPEGTPAPKHITESEDVTKILNLLDNIEAQFGFTFPEDDPRQEPGAHKSAGPASNKEKS
jgi:hypothetical protein